MVQLHIAKTITDERTKLIQCNVIILLIELVLLRILMIAATDSKKQE